MSQILKKAGFFIFGLVCLIIAILAGAVPGLPGFPFLIVSLWAFTKSNKHFHDWLLSLKIVQKTISQARDFKKHKAISVGSKIFLVIFPWVLFGTSLFFDHFTFNLRTGLYGTAAVFCTLSAFVFPTLKKTK